MARKFNIGRQGEQLLNEEWHGLFMSLKYLNYNRYKNIEDVSQERQTEIPERALRIKSREDLDLLQVYYPNLGEGTWKNLFEGQYHPINTIKPDEGAATAPYQLCIDPRDGYAIKYWDPVTNSWVVAKAAEYTGTTSSFNGMNFQFISPLEKFELSDKFYPVPYVPYGRLFDDSRYVSTFNRTNDCAIIPPVTADELSWVHVNASKLARVDRRLIELQKDPKNPDYCFIAITSTQSEFYLFEKGHRLGHLLRRDVDFKDVMGGIELSEEIVLAEKNKYIYAITYIFDETPSNEGSLIHNTHKVGGKNEVYIGAQISGVDNISLFMDGLSLEQKDEYDNDIYIHDEIEGTITFTDDDDAEIINEMQMTTLVFPKRTEEFSISNKAANVTATKDTVTVEVGNNINGWQTPMVFCSGLGLQETEIFEDVIINENKVTIKGLVLPGDEVIKGYVADVGDSFICKGVLNSPTIQHEKIEDGKEYAVFVNGILLTPTNRDLTVEDVFDSSGNRVAGKIVINNADDVAFDNLDYVVFEIDSSDDNKIALVFDETVSYYSLRINDGGAKATYNDCNLALVYIQDGILLDQAAIERPVNAVEGYYKGGQIIRTSDEYGNYEYFKYDYTEQSVKKLDLETISEVEHMIGYYATTGSIHLLGDNQAYEGATISYYAYNFANMIDEVSVQGAKNDLAIPAVLKPSITSEFDSATYNGSAKVLEAWRINCASLSTYINGLIVENKEIYDAENEGVTRKYSITYPKLNVIQNNYYGERNILDALNKLYNKYRTEVEKYKAQPEYANTPESKILNTILTEVDLTKWEINKGETLGDYLSGISLCRDALQLAIYLNVDMKREHTSYVIEKIERDEFMAAYRDFIYLEVPAQGSHGQIYKAAQDTVEADFLLVPGTVNVYLNGVLLPYEDYCKFDNNKIMFNVDVCGLQQLPKPEKMKDCLQDHLSYDEKQDYEFLYNRKQVMRIIDRIPYYIPTSSRDTILIEKRNDMSIKTVTYDVLVSSYSSLEFTQDYYDIPESLSNTADTIKIYINGVYYDGGYTLTKQGGIRGIRLLDEKALVMDPLYEYFVRNPEKADEYMKLHGVKYKRAIDKITFEWR